MSPRKRKGPPKAQSPKAVIRTQNAEKETFGSQGTSMDSLETEVTAAITNEAEGGLGSTEDVSVVLLAQESSQKKWRNWWIRTLWTFLMISGFVCILLAGHLWVILLVMAIVTLIYREVISIGIAPVKALQVLPWYTFLHWYFYAVTVYYLYIETLAYYCKPTPFVERFLMPAAIHHRFISFLLYMAGFILFVVNLKKGHYRFQFSHFGWTHMTLLFVLSSSNFVINNIFEGLFWLILPALLVVCNDIMAYIVGFFFGRTPLIRLSPKKTWEGFVGGFICTVIFGYFLAGFLAQFPYVTCPVINLTTNSLSSQTCSPNIIFLPRQAQIPDFILDVIKGIYPAFAVTTFTYYPVQLHSLVLSTFASLVAPFGGFFASGVKRAFKVKDFGDSIPGHGGITDRMDCQFLMGIFSYIYVQSFIGASRITVLYLYDLAIQHLSSQDQRELYTKLGEFITSRGV